MKVSELKELIKDLPDDKDVLISVDCVAYDLSIRVELANVDQGNIYSYEEDEDFEKESSVVLFSVIE